MLSKTLMRRICMMLMVSNERDMWLTSLDNKFFLCLQEVKIVGLILSITLLTIWPRDKVFYLDHVDGKGGVTILVSPQFANISLIGA